MQTGWRAIETAPRDGTEIIAAFHASGQIELPLEVCAVRFEDGRWMDGPFEIWPPTWWMPFPDPPPSAA